MQYRITYRQPEQREAFLESRWAAQPAELLTLALDRALIGDVVSSSACRLQVDLDEFVQVFDAPTSSRSRVAVRAELLAARSDAPLARRIFMIEHPAETLDAEGGVMAHRAGVHRLSTEMADWLRGLDQIEGQGLNSNGRCKR
jgi:cholesterol transport system auxiliary component